MIRGLMPLGVAQHLEGLSGGRAARVIRGLMPLGVAQTLPPGSTSNFNIRDSWLDAVRRCSNIKIKLLTTIAKVIRGLIRLDYSFTQERDVN